MKHVQKRTHGKVGVKVGQQTETVVFHLERHGYIEIW